jgi:hypothetical protein
LLAQLAWRLRRHVLRLARGRDVRVVRP